MPETQHSNELHNAGLKATTARLRVLQLFEGSPADHLSAEDIHKRLMEMGEEIGLATIYRVLSHFEVAGLLIRHNFEDGRAVYELAVTGHHDHMVDLESGEIIEFVDEEIEALQQRIAAKHGYDIVSHNLVLFVRVQR